ncbi:MAG: hypothetical protein LBJ46_08410 [Planctomycetota bacterium]|jgi:hypothetical protein|nr:hypothetical protein [Planctomycetota bacterium]
MGRLILRLAALCLPLFAAPSGAGEELALPPYERRVRLDVWGGTLTDAANALYSQTGVQIAIFPPDFPDEVETQPLYMVSGDATLRQAMECLARRYGFRYRLAGNSRIEVSRGYGWANANYLVRFHNTLDPLLGPAGDREELFRLLTCFLRVLPLLPGDASFRIEEAAPGEGQAIKGVTVLPGPLTGYFEQAVAALVGGSAAAPPRIQPAARARVPRRTDWNAILASDLALPATGARPREAAMIAAKALEGVLAWKSEPPAHALQQETAMRGRTVGALTGELGSWSGLGKRVLLDGGVIVFEQGLDGEIEEVARGREFFWDGLTVAGFDAVRAAARSGGGAELVLALRRDVFPDIWFDPACGMGYSPVTGRIAVVAPQNVVEAVAHRLRELAGEE